MTSVAFADMRISKVVGIAAGGDEATYCAVLEEVGGMRVLPIEIGWAEAFDLHRALDGRALGRPMAADFAARLVHALGGAVRQVRIDRVVDGAYAATVEIAGPHGTASVDARSSDALNLAARAHAPVAAAPAVLADAAERRSGDGAEAALLRQALVVPGLIIRRAPG